MLISTYIVKEEESAMRLNTYLNYGGNCAEAFRFYEQHLGAKVLMLMTHGDQPGGSAPAGLENKVLYARMSIGGTDLVGSDVPAGHFQPMRSVYLSLTMDSSEEVEQTYALLSDGGEIFMAI